MGARCAGCGKGKVPGEAHGHGALGEKPTGCSLRGTEDGPGDARWGQAVGAARVPESTEGSSSCETCKETEAINLLKACSALSVTPLGWDFLGWDLLGWDLPTRRSYPPPPRASSHTVPSGRGAAPPGRARRPPGGPAAASRLCPCPEHGASPLSAIPSPPSPHRAPPRLASPRLSRPRFPSPRCRWVGAEMAAG